jgi:antitoxin HicB
VIGFVRVKKETMKKKKKAVRSSARFSTLDDLLKQESKLEVFQAIAIKETLAWQLAQAMKASKMSRKGLAERMKTSRSQISRLLDPKDGNVTISTLQRAARVVGRSLRLELVKTNASEEKGSSGRQSIPDREVDQLVLSTTNAPYKRVISAAQLAKHLASGKTGRWHVHVATFFTDVRPELILKFAAIHGVSRSNLITKYRAVKAATGEANPRLEAALEQLAPAA